MTALEKQMLAPGFWDNQDSARKVVGELKSLKAVVAPTEELSGRLEDLQVHYELAAEADSEREET